MRRRQWIGIGLAAGLAPTALVRAQAAFPSRQIRLVVPFPPGGPTDLFARLYGQRLSVVLGQPVVIDNKAGASGAIGSLEVMRAAPDGYTLLFGTASTHALYNLMNPKPQYDSLKDFAHVAIVGGAAVVLIANLALPGTLKGVLDMARAQPGKLRYGSPGSGTLMHIAAERLKREAGGLDIQHIPYKGTGQSKPALLGGQIELMTDTLGSSLAEHKAGKARILAVAAAKRSPQAPEVPTFDEAMGTRGFEAVLWNVVAAPAGTPSAVLEALSAASARVMADATLNASLANLAIEPTLGSNPAAATAYIRAEMARWKPVIDAAGITAE
ncbi:MAG: tripartite tricarboxylate transporter substrate binding protein [Burkholderiales bacterium]|nr:tripartite tricarboxylate transporter substrate binding protein [Burkholderiales bacterium]